MRQWLFKGGVVVLGLVLVFVSIARASLDVLAKEMNEDAIKNRLMEFSVVGEEGKEDSYSYKLPEVGMLPSSPFYGFKKIRDWLWLNLASGVNRSKVALLMADKKMTESGDLFLANQNRTAIEAGIEAMDKLEYADSLIEKLPETDETVSGLRKQLFLAGRAYSEIVRVGEENFDLDQVKYNVLKTRIENWNKKQEEVRWVWEN